MFERGMRGQAAAFPRKHLMQPGKKIQTNQCVFGYFSSASSWINTFVSCFHVLSNVQGSSYKLLPVRKKICPAAHPPKHF